MKRSILVYLLAGLAIGLKARNYKPSEEYVSALKRVTDIMVNDVTSPVASARYYAYTTMAAYEVSSALQPEIFPTLGKIPQIKKALGGTPIKEKALTRVSILALWKTAANLLPSGAILLPEVDSMTKTLPPATVQLTNQIVAEVISLAMTDGFLQLNNLKRYTPKRGPAFWQPTGPAFMAPVEPHWRTIRPMILDSANQFLPIPPVAFDTAKNTPFYQLLQEVYDVVRLKDIEREKIANFWDCNPYHISQMGHIEFGTKKISPGGHWMGITGIACNRDRRPVGQTILIHALVAITLHDAFIACWDEKYRSHRVRPETAIREFIDKSWTPILQTPPFPEYLSGHSVASSAASVVLTQIFGNGFPFDDSVEVEFGLPVRSFSSFADAAMEASLSRLYGGIHFRDAIEQGIWQGKSVGQYVSDKLKNHLAILKKAS
jgi:hypothetical protein